MCASCSITAENSSVNTPLPSCIVSWTLERVNCDRMLEQSPSEWHVVPIEHERHGCIAETSPLEKA